MLKLLLDANVPHALFRGLARRSNNVDLLRIQDIGLRTASDPDILAFAAREGRILITRDKATMRDFAAQRIREGKPMPGLLVVRPGFLSRGAGIGTVINEILLIAEVTRAEEWHDVIQFLPFLSP